MLNKIKEKLEKEICDLLDKQPLTKDDVCLIGELTDALKDVSTAQGMDAYGGKYLGDEDMPYDSYGMYGMRTPHLSYRRGRSPSTGRYMSMDEDPNIIHAKFGSGYSGHSVNDQMIASLEHLVDKMPTDYERQQVISEIESLRKR